MPWPRRISVTFRYAPSQAYGPAVLSPAADVWSLGVTLHEMVSGAVPFRGSTFEQLVANVMQLRYVMPQASADVQQLIRSILLITPCERMTVAELCAEPWVLHGGDLPSAHALPAPSSVYSGRIDRGRAGGALLELARQWQGPLLNGVYALLIGGILVWGSLYSESSSFDLAVQD